QKQKINLVVSERKCSGPARHIQTTVKPGSHDAPPLSLRHLCADSHSHPQGGVPVLSTPQNVALYSKIPILFVVGDRAGTQSALVHAAEETLLNAGGVAKALVLPEVGITGNSHVFVVEKNNLQIAELIIDWLRTNVK